MVLRRVRRSRLSFRWHTTCWPESLDSLLFFASVQTLMNGVPLGKMTSATDRDDDGRDEDTLRGPDGEEEDQTGELEDDGSTSQPVSRHFDPQS